LTHSLLLFGQLAFLFLALGNLSVALTLQFLTSCVLLVEATEFALLEATRFL